MAYGKETDMKKVMQKVQNPHESTRKGESYFRIKSLFYDLKNNKDQENVKDELIKGLNLQMGKSKNGNGKNFASIK